MKDAEVKKILDKAELLLKKKQLAKALEIYTELAREGDATAQIQIGKLHEGGLLGPDESDPDMAEYWYRQAAEQGNDEGRIALADWYCNTKTAERSLADAYLWYRRSHLAGNSQALTRLKAINESIFGKNKSKPEYSFGGNNYSTVQQACKALINGWGKWRLDELKNFLQSLRKEGGGAESSSPRSLTELIKSTPPQEGYELIADINEFKLLEYQCAESIEKTLTNLVLYCLKSKHEKEPSYGENISIYKEMKIAFDGYSEDDEEPEGEKSESYAIYIHKDSLKKSFTFPEHQSTPFFAVVHRPGAEAYLNVWYDRRTQNLSLDASVIQDGIDNAKLGIIQVNEIVQALGEQYGIQIISDIADVGEKRSTRRFYYTISAAIDYIDYERTTDSPGAAEAIKSAELIWATAERAAVALKHMGRNIESVYVGISPNYSDLYPVDFSRIRGKQDKKSDQVNFKNFMQIAADALCSIWPDEIERIYVTFKINDEHGIPGSDELLKFSADADIDCEAITRDPATGLLFLQGYDQGDYDTGFISNDSDEIYLLTNPYNKELLNLQTSHAVESAPSRSSSKP